MPEPVPSYQRLSRAFFGMNGTGALWLGKDHLVQVTNAMAVEHYRRWYFADIQAIVLRRTNTRMIWNIVVGGGGLLILAGAAVCILGSRTSSSTDAELLLGFGIFLGIIGLILASIATVNTVMGPTCVMNIQTPHGFDKLAGPTRVRRCEDIIARITPLLQGAQAGAGKDELRQVASALDQPPA